MEPVGRSAEVQLLGDGDEVAQVAQLHVSALIPKKSEDVTQRVLDSAGAFADGAGILAAGPRRLRTLRAHGGDWCRRGLSRILVATLITSLAGTATADIVYLYDDLNRLVRVIDANNQAATYAYDAVGNLLSIVRASIPQTASVSSISTSTFTLGTSASATVDGVNLAGATVTASAGISIVLVRADVDSLLVQVVVEPGAPVGPGLLTIQTDLGTVTVPVTVTAGTQTITTVAGTGGAAFALPVQPMGVAVDAQGALFIADTENHLIRKVTVGGATRLVAGSGNQGGLGDGGPAFRAQLQSPTGVAVDGQGNVFIADSENSRVRKVSADGTMSTFAGQASPAGGGISGYSGDGGPATSALLMLPWAVAVDGQGNVFIADAEASVIRKVNPAGTITTFAGDGVPDFGGDGGPATSAQLNFPQGVAVDGQGNVFIADTINSRIRKVAPNGTITTVAGTGDFDFYGDGGPATDAALMAPEGIAADGQGNLLIADTGNGRIRKVNSSGTITTIAGTGDFGFGGDGGPAIDAQFDRPVGVAGDSQGNVFVADQFNDRVRKISAAGTITSVVTVLGSSGPAVQAPFFFPGGPAVDTQGNIYVTDFLNNRVEKVTPDGMIATVAGTLADGFSGDGGPATAAELSGPVDVAVDGQGNLFIADSNNLRIRKVSPAGTITTVAGNGTFGFSGDGGPATSAALGSILALTVDGQGNLYLIDSSRVRKVATTGTITTVAGNGTFGFSGDGGPATSAAMRPAGIVVDSQGNLFIADGFNHRVRTVNTSGIISTVAGTGIAGLTPGPPPRPSCLVPPGSPSTARGTFSSRTAATTAFGRSPRTAPSIR